MDKKKHPTIAVGIDNDEELNRKATKQDIKEGNYTKVSMLVNDEIDETE